MCYRKAGDNTHECYLLDVYESYAIVLPIYRVAQKKTLPTLRSYFQEVFLGTKVIFCRCIKHPT